MIYILSCVAAYVIGSIIYVLIATQFHIRSYPNCCDHAKQSEFFNGSVDYNNGRPWIDASSHYQTVLKKHAMLACMLPVALFTFLILFIVWVFLRIIILFYSFYDPSGKSLYNTFGIETLPSTPGTIPLESGSNVLNKSKPAMKDNDINSTTNISSTSNSANNSTTIKQRVCIIGGGPSGLITLKELLEFNDIFDITLYEQHAEIGGTFANSYKNGWLTSSSTITQFSWYITNNNVFWSFDEYVKYLKQFVKVFGLDKYINLGRRVINANYDSNTKIWTVKTGPSPFAKEKEDNANTKEEEGGFDHLIVCCGIAHIPRIPMKILDSVRNSATASDSVKQEAENSQIVHSMNIRDFSIFKGKNVLCVGLGESGSDISYNICKYANKLDLITRHGAGFVLPRYNGGIATDIDTSYAYQICRNWATLWPYTIKRNIESYYITPFDNMECLSIASKVNKQMVNEMINKYNVNPKLIFNRFKTKSTLFTLPIFSNKMEYKQCDITDIKYNGNNKQFMVQFDNNNNIDNNYDIIACCTGFDRYFTFLTKDNIPIYNELNSFDEAKLYKNIFDPTMNGNLAFIGYARPIIGSLIPLSELVARYVSMVLLPKEHDMKKVGLPNEEEMLEAIRLDILKKESMMRYDFLECKKKKRNLVDFLTYINEITGLLGSVNSFVTLFVYYPWLWYQILCGQIQSIHFRIFSRYNDKGRFNIDYIKKSLSESPLMPTPVLVIEFWVYVVHYLVKEVWKM